MKKYAFIAAILASTAGLADKGGTIGQAVLNSSSYQFDMYEPIVLGTQEGTIVINGQDIYRTENNLIAPYVILKDNAAKEFILKNQNEKVNIE